MTRRLVRAALALMAVPLLYLLAALLGGLVVVHRDFTPTPVFAGGVPIYLRTNGVHADLVVPAAAIHPASHDWRREFPPAQVVDAARVSSTDSLAWIAFGWGDRGFYLETPHWRDLRLDTAWTALSGQGRGAMHVEYLAVPEQFAVQRITIGASQYQRLTEFIRAGFTRDAGAAPLRIDHPGFGATDAFYEGIGRYTPWLTSNEWVRRALAHAGVRTALWAPFDAPLFWHLGSRAVPSRSDAATIRATSVQNAAAKRETE